MKEKESWIAKLVELLNEYEIEREEKIDLFNDKEKPLWEWYKDCTGDLTFEPTDKNKLNWEAFSWDTGYSVIISKSYGFIWRLVATDKIETRRLETVEIIPKFWWTIWKKAIWEKRILMLLSIQENPIDYLVSILK